MGAVYGLSNTLMRGALRIFGDWKVEGREITFMAKRGLFRNPVASQFFRAYGAFPLNESGNDMGAIQRSVRLLERDGALGIFPEGTRSPGGMRKAIPGISLIALRSGAPILPVGIVGTEVIGPPWQVAVPKGSFSIRIGQPFTIPHMEGNIVRGQLEAITTMIMSAWRPCCLRATAACMDW